MKIDEAIEILTNSTSGNDPWLDPDLKEATKLGIEALKEVERLRSYKALHVLKLLPGETPEQG